MISVSYLERRGEVATYFDRTAVEAWKRLTSDAPVGRIRATVRAGRAEMRDTLLGWLPDDLRGARVLDAGCGTGTLAVEAARRGADVVAVDLSPTLVGHAGAQAPADLGAGRLQFRAADMLEDDLGTFDFVVAMDSLIHYRTTDAVQALGKLAARAEASVLFTFAPWTPMLAAMHAVGRLFPRSDRAPAIEPVAEPQLRREIARDTALAAWQPARAHRVMTGFYMSHAMELVRR